MAEIFDLIAKVSWDTNEAELTKMNSALKNQDKVLEELRLKGRRLEEQLVKTNDPKKVATLNAELKKTMQSADAIVANQKKQIELTQRLQNESKKLGDSLRANINNPQATKGLLQQLHTVENQLGVLSTKAQSLPSKFGGIGQALMGGLGLGAGAFGAEALVSGVVGFVGGAIDEILEAEKATRNLELALEAIGKKNYLEGLLTEATELSQKFNNLYDNDEIAQAQTEFVKYGKVTRQELKQLTEVSIELASKLGIDVVTASNKVIDILAGRGSSTLRDFGLSTKDAKTETERMNLVLVDLANKVKGASIAYANSAEGMRKQNELLVANAKENIGAKLLPIYEGFLKGLGDLLNGEFGDVMDRLSGRGLLVDMMKAQRLMIQNQVRDIVGDIDKLEKAIYRASQNNVGQNVIDAMKIRLEDLRAEKQMSQEKLSNIKENEDEVKKSEKKKVETVKKANDVKKEDTEAYYDQLWALDVEYQKLLDQASQQAINRVDDANKKRLERNEKYRQMEIDLIKENMAAELQGDDTDREKNRIAMEMAVNNISATAYEVNSIIALEQQKNDKLIQLQEERLENAKKTSSASLKVEQDRLNELLEKRRKYERAQRVIDAGVIVANQAVAISGAIKSIATSTTVVEKVANVLALVAGITASIAAVRSAFQDTGFKDGGYTGDGNPNETSTRLGRKPYTYHKGEFVMDADLTNENRDMFEGLHKRKLSVKRLDDGSYYLTPDVYKMSSDYESSKYSNSDIGLLQEMKAVRKLLQAREVNIQNNFDAEGFGQSVATQIGYAQLKQKLR